MAAKVKGFWDKYFENCYRKAVKHVKKNDDYESFPIYLDSNNH